MSIDSLGQGRDAQVRRRPSRGNRLGTVPGLLAVCSLLLPALVRAGDGSVVAEQIVVQEIVVQQTVVEPGQNGPPSVTDCGPEGKQRHPKQILEKNALVCTGPGVSVLLFFPPSAQVWIGPNSRVDVSGYVPDQPSWIELMVGRVRATFGLNVSGLPEFRVKAGSVFAAPFGTDFLMARTSEGTVDVTVLEGSVNVGGAEGAPVKVDAGLGVTATPEGRVGTPERVSGEGLTLRLRQATPSLLLQRPGLGLEIPRRDTVGTTPRYFDRDPSIRTPESFQPQVETPAGTTQFVLEPPPILPPD